jgi:Immunity protein 21
MGKKRSLQFIETEGGPFILLPMELKKSWSGVGDPDEGIPSDYEKAEKFVATVGVLDLGKGQALVLGDAEVTAFWSLDDGGVFIQRIMGDEDADVIAVVERALADSKGWKRAKLAFDPGAGKLALFDAAYAYADSDEDERLTIALAPGLYGVETRTVTKGEDVEVALVRLRATKR